MTPQIGHIFKMLKMQAMKTGQLCERFWDLKLVNYMETNVFLGSLLSKNICFRNGDLKMLPSFETHHIYIVTLRTISQQL